MPLYIFKKLSSKKETLFNLAIKLNAKTDKELIFYSPKIKINKGVTLIFEIQNFNFDKSIPINLINALIIQMNY